MYKQLERKNQRLAQDLANLAEDFEDYKAESRKQMTIRASQNGSKQPSG